MKKLNFFSKLFSKKYVFKNPDSVPNNSFSYNNPMYTDKIYRLYSWSKGKKMPPFKLIIVPTNRCNLKCFCCPNAYARSSGRFKQKDELSDEKWLKLIDDALEFGLKEFYILGGGEPMLRRELVLKIIKKVKTYNSEYVTEIISNGTLFTKQDCEDLVDLKHNKLLFSIDGSNSESHDYARGVKGTFEKAKKTVQIFVDLKKQKKADKPVLQMNTVINNKNYNTIVDIVNFAIEIGFNELAIHPMREYEEVKESMQHLKLNQEQTKIMYDEIKKAQKIAKEHNFFLNTSMIDETEKLLNQKMGKNKLKNNLEEKQDINQIDNKTKGKNKHPYCYEPFYSIFVDPKGNYNFCCAAGDGIDDNNISQGLEKLWYGDFFNNIRNSLSNHNLAEKCSKCGLLDMTSNLRKEVDTYRKFIKKE